jgi:pimeloyl-ACP methyl ester carboxylesterase
MTDREIDKRTIARPVWLDESVWPFAIRTANVDGSTVAYTDEGEGDILLLVHDGMWSFLWGQVISRLRDRFRVVTLDFPGSGLSPANDETAGLETDSKLLERFVDQLELTGITLVVHDLGGPVGLGLAIRRPQLVAGLVLVNTFAWPPHTRSLRMMMRVMSSAPVRGLNVTTNFLSGATSSRFGVGSHLSDEAKLAFTGPFAAKGPRRRFHELMGSVLDEHDYLAGVETALRTSRNRLPVLTVYGERNDPFRFQARFKTIFPDAEEMVIPKGNHFPMCDDPDGFSARVAEWHRSNR